MAYNTFKGNYVVFVRTTPTLWAKVADEDKNFDTLYFVAEKNAKTGLLYLGSTLISGGASSETSLSDLNDVVIDAGIDPGSILVYNGETEKWEDRTFAEVLADEISVFTGPTQTTAGTSGLVPVPQPGDDALFLKGDGTWADPLAGMETVISNIETLMGDEDTEGSVQNIVKGAIGDLIGAAPETLDTLEEIAEWIENHKEVSDLSNLETRVTNLENIINDTQVGEGDNIQTIPGLQSTVATYVSRIDKDIIPRLSDVEDALTWRIMTE